MKKVFCPLFAATALFMVVANNSNAQGRNDLAFNEAKKIASSAKKTASGAVEVNSSEVSLKAQKDFSKTFNSASNVKWFKVDDGFIATFTAIGIAMRSNYDQKGNWKYDLTTYTEEKLSPDVRSQVKNVYYDYSITLVNEIKTAEGTMYVVHMTNKSSWINLLVSGDAMEVIEQNEKSK